MRIISTIIVAVIAMSVTGCVSYSRHEREDRVVEHRHGGYHGERSHRHGGYYRHRYDHHRHDHHRHHGDRDRHHPRGR